MSESAVIVPQRIAAQVGGAGAAMLADFVAYLQNGPERYSPTTIETYLHHLGTFIDTLGAAIPVALPALVDKVALNRALIRIPADRASTRRNMVSALKALARFLVDLGHATEDMAAPVLALKLRFKAEPKRPYLKSDQIEQSIRALIADPEHDASDRLVNVAIFATAALTGIRNSELCHLQIQDLDFGAGTLTVHRGKGGKSRTLGIPDRLAPLLKLQVRQRDANPADPIFVAENGRPFNRYSLHKRFKRMNLPEGIVASPHRLRRSFATYVNNRGVPLDKIQVALGHADIKTTRDYIQTQPAEVAQEMRGW